MRTLLFIILLVPLLGFAEVYKWTDQDGKVHYSDKPQQNAVEVKVKPVSTLPAFRSYNRNTGLPSPRRGAQAVPYESFVITSPTPDTVFRGDATRVTVQLALSPPLQAGHSIELRLNGQPLEQRFRTTIVPLGALARGAYQLQASVIPDQGGDALISTTALTFSVHKPSRLHKR